MFTRVPLLTIMLVGFTTWAASLAGAANPRDEYQALKTLHDTHQLLDAPRGTEADLAWAVERAGKLYDQGRAFMSTHVTHPLRWDVLVLLQYAGHLQLATRADGSRYVTQPAQERAEWARKYVGMLEDLLESADAGSEARHEALLQLIDYHALEVRRGVVDSPRKGLVPALLVWVTELHALAPQSNRLPTLYLRVARMLNAVDPPRCRIFLQEKWALHPGKTGQDPDIRRQIESFQRLMRNQDGPANELWARLRQLEPPIEGASGYRGRVVLVANLAVDWTSRTRELERLYEKYHDAGLEIIQVASENRGVEVVRVGSETRFRPPPPLVQRDREAMKRYVAERNWPWPVLWEASSSTPRFDRYWGMNTIPAFLIVRRNGRIAREIPGELSLDVRIAREIKNEAP